jgi:DNA-binding transcriptional ArsR family regulator
VSVQPVRTSIDILRLRVLAVIAAQESVTKAAKHLNYSQPAVSHHLARLEAETGARLVQRVGRGIRLTASGSPASSRRSPRWCRTPRAPCAASTPASNCT